MMKKERRKRRRLLRIAGGILAEAILLRLRGYPMGTDVVVRCHRGHLFSTIWLPGYRSRRFGSCGGGSSVARSAGTGRGHSGQARGGERGRAPHRP